MRWSAQCAIGLMVVASTCGAGASHHVSELSWLSGAWKLEAGERSVAEWWSTPAGGMLIGMSRTVNGDKIESFEFLRIEEREGSVYYVAQPEGRPPTDFHLVEVRDGKWTFENQQLEFPRRIIYRRLSAHSVTARIEDDSGRKAIEFPYSKAD